MVMKAFIVSLIAMCLSVNSFAANISNNNNYNSMRALGMGNAFTAVANDYSLIFYNPAGFAKKPYNEVQVSLIGAGVAASTLTFADDIKKAGDTPGSDTDKANAISDALDRYYGKTMGGKVQALEMFWVRKGWGVAILPLDMNFELTVNRQVGPVIDINLKGDSSFTAGYGASYNKDIDWGVSGRFLHRVALDQSITAVDLANDSNIFAEDRFKEGTAVDFDLGIMWTPSGWFGSSSSAPAPEAAPAPTESTAPEATSPPADAATAKPEEKKAEEAKPAEAKPEEPRTPQAEGDATEVKVADEKKAEEAKPADAKADAAAKPEGEAGVVKLGEEKPAEVKPEEPKKEEAVAETKSEGSSPLTLGLVVHNVLGSSFTLSKMVNKNATTAPAKLERTIDIGSQYRLVDGEDFKIRAMLDVKNILHPLASLNRCLHAGIEFDYSPSGWFKTQFRAGMNQMYYTAGATLLLGVVNIDVVTYGEEVGSNTNKIENRVMAAKLGFNF
jgi:hypothetical protein